jgi:L-methionine (R)-S-oxide reductase
MSNGQKAIDKNYLLSVVGNSQRQCSLPNFGVPPQRGTFLFMAEDLTIVRGTKEEQYEALLPQIKGLLEGETDLIANLANIAAALKEQFGWLWVGFYLVKGEELVLGPFQGPVACTRIRKGRGVCGSSWAKEETLIVPDVEKFPGHIACSSLSRSEIVLPLFSAQEVIGVLDVDSEQLNEFDETDKFYLEKIIALLSTENKKTQDSKV